MSKMKHLMMMYAMAGMMGGMGGIGHGSRSKSLLIDEDKLKRKAKNLPCNWNGQANLHKYTINGVEIEATDKLTARKIYNRKYKNA